MSFCPHRLPLFRLRTRSPSCFAAQRLRAIDYQRRRSIGTRRLSENAPKSSTVTVDDIYDGLGISAGQSSVSSDDFVAGSFTDTNRESSRDTVEPDVYRETGKLTARSPLYPDFDVLQSRIPKTRYSRDGPVQKGAKNLSRKTVDEVIETGSKPLNANPRKIHMWRAARDKIFAARLLQKSSRISLEFNEEDNSLLNILKADPDNAFRNKWASLLRHDKLSHWQRLSLWLLYHSPEFVPDFLRITCQDTDKPRLIFVTDCIRFLLKLYPDVVDQSLITICLHPDNWPIHQLPQKAVRIYVENSERNAVYYAWSIAREKRMILTPESLLCFMKRFTELGDIDSAIEAIRMVQNMENPEFSMDSEAVIRHCCKLLTLDSVVGDGSERNFRILPKLLQLGVQPTRDLMNVVLSNAYKTGDSQLGQDILNYMQAQGLKSDSYTYLTLLTNAVGAGDSQRLEALLQEIQVKEELHRNPWIMSKVLHAHFLSMVKENDFTDDPNAFFYSMLAMYNRLHDITPLKELSVVPYHYNPPSGSGDSPPSVVALYIVISTYLRCVKSIVNVEHVYSRFRQLVLEGHGTIAPLAATDHTYNEFLVAFRNDPRGLRPAVRLVEDMLSSVPKDAPTTKRIARIGVEHAPPSSQTWNILMSCFVFNRQPHAADKVKAMMGKHGVPCLIDTWNMIINNHANSQNVPALAQAIKQMELEGFTPDKYTHNSLRFLRDPERLWAAVEELDQGPDPGSGVESSSQAAAKEPDSVSLLDQGLQRLKDSMKAKT